MIHRLVRDLSYEPNIYMSCSTSEIMVRLVPSKVFKPSSNFLSDRSNAVPLFVICVSCHTVLSVSCSIVVTYRERTDILACLYMLFSFFSSLSNMVSWVRCGIDCTDS